MCRDQSWKRDPPDINLRINKWEMLIQFLRLGVMPGQNTCAMHVGVKANAVVKQSPVI